MDYFYWTVYLCVIKNDFVIVNSLVYVYLPNKYFDLKALCCKLWNKQAQKGPFLEAWLIGKDPAQVPAPVSCQVA